MIDVVITLCYILLIGRCYAMWCGTTLLLQEGIELSMADVIAIFFCSVRLMLLPFGKLADVIASG